MFPGSSDSENSVRPNPRKLDIATATAGQVSLTFCTFCALVEALVDKYDEANGKHEVDENSIPELQPKGTTTFSA